MKTLRYFLLLGAVLFLSACATTFRPWSLSEIQEGMDREQVIRILGEPDFVSVKDGAEHMHYTYQEDYNPGMSDDLSQDRAIDLQMHAQSVERYIKVYEYDVIVVDGKVLNYKEVAN